MNQPRLKEFYQKNAIPELLKKFKFKNAHQVPKLEKVVINIGVGEAKDNIKALETAISELGLITGQKPVMCRAKKSVSNFKIRENMPIGTKVTLRNAVMY